jgi:hypothetical protein
MIFDIILILLLLWFLGVVQIPGFTFHNIIVLYFNGRPITLGQALIFFIIIMAIGILPNPIKQIAIVIFALWILSIIGIVTIVGFSNLLVLGIII